MLEFMIKRWYALRYMNKKIILSALLVFGHLQTSIAQDSEQLVNTQCKVSVTIVGKCEMPWYRKAALNMTPYSILVGNDFWDRKKVIEYPAKQALQFSDYGFNVETSYATDGRDDIDYVSCSIVAPFGISFFPEDMQLPKNLFYKHGMSSEEYNRAGHKRDHICAKEISDEETKEITSQLVACETILTSLCTESLSLIPHQRNSEGLMVSQDPDYTHLWDFDCQPQL